MIRLGWGFPRPKRGREAQKASQTGAKGDPLARAIELHRRGVEGDREAAREAHEILAGMMDSPRATPRVKAYLGSATALLGRDAVDPNERFALAIKGLRILDQAVAEEPGDPETRTLRGYVCLRLPEAFFHRTATAVEDFRWLVSKCEENPSAYPADRYHRFLFELGSALWNLDRKEEAGEVWRKLLAAAGDPEYRRLLREKGFAVPEEDRAPESGRQDTETGIPAEGIDLHRRALEGEPGAAGRARDFFARLRAERPDDPVIQAYYADCLSLTGRDADDPSGMFAVAIQAMKMLDAAVNTAPDDVRIRLLRAGQGLRLPEPFFHRTATAAEDLSYLAARYEGDRSLFPEGTYRRVLYDLGCCYLRLGLKDEAEAAWKKLAGADPAGEYATRLAERRRLAETVRTVPLSGKALRREAVRLHDLAVEGSMDAARAALELWERIRRADPGDAEAEAYYGSSLALAGRYAGEPKEIFDKAIKGLLHLNKAAARDWRNPRIRLLRGYLAHSLPEAFFHLAEKAARDFRFVKSAWERDHTVLPREVYLRVLRDLGEAYRRLGQEDRAEKVWARLRREDPGAAPPSGAPVPPPKEER